MGACVRDVILVEEERDGGDIDSEASDGETSSWSDGGFVAVPKAFQRVGVPGFLKRTYGVLAYDPETTSVERRRKSAKLDEQLDGLREVLPSAMSRSKERNSVVSDAYRYIAALQRQVQDLCAELLEDESATSAQTLLEDEDCEDQWSCLSHPSELRHEPLVEVVKQEGALEVHIVCANRPGLLVDVMDAVESRGLTVMQARIACHNEIVVEYLSLENEEGGENDEEEEESVKAMLVHAICNDVVQP